MWQTKYASTLYLKTWDWDLIFGRAVKAISLPGVRSPWTDLLSIRLNYVANFY